ncbi:MAG: dihydropteroate synthase [Muribaculaceae bacterium]|nr:dihydropteroate synthase [Muribaculaceae bacterium]
MKQNHDLTINIGGRLLDFCRPWVMGILNVTSDSFFSGCRADCCEEVRARVRAVRDEGADCIDIGACSTRPGSLPVEPGIELKRLVEAISIVRAEWPDAVISVDTFRASVARRCVEAGADIINDISGGSLDPDMFAAVADLKVPYILTHMRGTPASMSSLAHYDDVVADVITELAYRIRDLRQLGVCDIIVDPGFGFAKDVGQNYQLLASLSEICRIGLPVLVGISRKSMICRPLGITPAEALPATIALDSFALLQGASILRVHDVAEAVQARDALLLATNPANLLTANCQLIT